jgi:LEA14-like dessication related protein
MSKQRVKRYGKIGGIVVLVLVVLVGALFALGILGVPDAGLEDNDWGEVDDERIEVITTVWVDNPNPIGGGDGDVEYDVELQGVHLAQGEGEGLSLPSGESTHEFRTDLFYNRLSEWWYAHLTNDEVSDVRVNATANVSAGPVSGSPSGTYEDTVDTDIEGALDRGFSEFEGTYSGTEADVTAPDGTAIEPTVEVESVTTQWGEVTETQTEILVNASIHNPNAYPIPTPAFTGYVAMNEIRVADWDADEVEVLEVTDEGLIPSGETEERTFRIEMDNENVPEWFATHVDRGEQSDVEVAGQLAFEISGSEVTIPQQEEGISCEFDLTTSIFVDDQETDMEFQQCGTAPLSIAQGELDAAGAVLDITETDWWLDLGSGSDGDDGSDGNGDDGDDGVVPSRDPPVPR